MKLLKIFLSLIVLLTMYLGLQAMSYESDIFKRRADIYCKYQHCEATGPHLTVKCNSTVKVEPVTACTEITTDCYECVDLTLSGCLCTEGSDWCIKPDDTYYYGTNVNCDSSFK